MERSYPAKLLLFGEYAVLNGAQALAVPLTNWSGRWQEKDMQDEKSIPFFEWLAANSIIGATTLDKMIRDNKAGWSFESTIPIGHGVGSSGAYVAAVYDRYIKDERKDDLLTSGILARIESFFHGSSSGMDPLVSIEQKAVLKDDRGQFHLINHPGWPQPFKVYLWDSGIERETSPLVSVYKNKLSDLHYKLQVERTLIPMSDHAIHFYLQNQPDMLAECIRVISAFQKNYFKEMIPPEVEHVWQTMEQTNGVFMKLCGAGGGGYYLVISTRGEEMSGPGLCLLP